MSVEIITNPQELLLQIESADDIIIDFYADWCGPCKRGESFFTAWSTKYPNIKFVKFNVDNLNNEETEAYDITTIPYLKRYKKGNHIKSMEGLNPEILNTLLT